MAGKDDDDVEITSEAEQDEQGPGPGLRSTGKQFADEDDEPQQETDDDDVADGSGKQFGKKGKEHHDRVEGSGKQMQGDQDD